MNDRDEPQLEGALTALDRAHDALDRLGRSLAHEVRAPLSTVSFACELLKTQELDEGGERQVERIHGAVREITAILDAMLRYTAVSRPQATVEVDLSRLVSEVTDELAPFIDARGAAVRADSLPVVRGAVGPLRTMLRELIRYGLREGGDAGEVCIDATRLDAGGWEIRVADRGPGLDPGLEERLFDPFEQDLIAADGSPPGVGLAICRRVAEAHGGSIEVQRRDDGGLSFRVQLPATPLLRAAPTEST